MRRIRISLALLFAVFLNLSAGAAKTAAAKETVATFCSKKAQVCMAISGGDSSVSGRGKQAIYRNSIVFRRNADGQEVTYSNVFAHYNAKAGSLLVRDIRGFKYDSILLDLKRGKIIEL